MALGRNPTVFQKLEAGGATKILILSDISQADNVDHNTGKQN